MSQHFFVGVSYFCRTKELVMFGELLLGKKDTIPRKHAWNQKRGRTSEVNVRILLLRTSLSNELNGWDQNKKCIHRSIISAQTNRIPILSIWRDFSLERCPNIEQNILNPFLEGFEGHNDTPTYCSPILAHRSGRTYCCFQSGGKRIFDSCLPQLAGKCSL